MAEWGGIRLHASSKVQDGKAVCVNANMEPLAVIDFGLGEVSVPSGTDGLVVSIQDFGKVVTEIDRQIHAAPK